MTVKIRAIAAVILAVVLASSWFVYSWHKSSGEKLQQAVRQYGEIRSMLAEYDMLRHQVSTRPQTAAKQSLFSAINEKSAELGFTACIESLRPSASQDQKTEILDLQMRGLYLSEAMRWLQTMEALPDVRIDTLNLRRTDKQLLDLDMRLVKSQGAPGT